MTSRRSERGTLKRRVIRTAEPADGNAMLELLEQHTTPGGFSLLYTRRPNAYEAYFEECAEAELTVCEDRRGVLNAQVAVLPRELYLGGRPQKVGYVTGVQRREGSLAPVPQMLRYAWDKSSCEQLYCSVLAHNNEVRALFGRPREGLPQFEPLCTYQTYLVGPRALMRLSSARDTQALGDLLYEANAAATPPQTGTPGASPVPLDGNSSQLPSELSAFYARESSKLAGFPCVEQLVGTAGLQSRDFIQLTRGGKTLAACALWDQRAYKQYIVKQYAGVYRLAARAGMLLQVLGYFALPKPEAVASCMQVSFLHAEEHDERLARVLLAQVGRELLSRGSFACIGAAQGSKLSQLLETIPSIHFSSVILGTEALIDSVADASQWAFQCALL